MTMLELLTIPGMGNTDQLNKMRAESQRRMLNAAQSQMLAAAIMNQRQKKRAMSTK